MTDKKEHSAMGLPRASGKRRWCDDGDDGGQSPPKAVCTSPPYALCAEDVLPNPPTSIPTSSSSAMVTGEAFDECEITHLPDEDKESGASDCDEDTILSDRPRDDDEEDEDDEDEENFIDDEEDKDSGFIDGNSIDNSSDDEGDVKGNSADASFTSSSSSSSSLKATHPLPPSPPPAPKLEPDASQTTNLTSTETELQISLAKVLSPSPPASSHLPTTITTSTTCFVTTSGSSISASRHVDVKGDSVLTTVTATTTQTGTTVTSAYPGAVPTPTYDPSSTYSPSPSDPFPPPNRPGSPAWSCTFYDGSQPTTNKYMEISPSPAPGTRTPPTAPAPQSIQCDENGKSYLELGSASPYTSPYASECFTTSPSSYNGASYSQSFSGAAAPYGAQAGTYFNPGGSRSNYAPPGPAAPSAPPAPAPGPPANSLSSPYGYPGGESYGTYDGGDGMVGSCSSYGYSSTGNSPPYPPQGQNGRTGLGGHPHPGPVAGGRGGPPLQHHQQRCSSPICDPTRGSPRTACYPQQRLSVLNLSMLKLNRFSRFPEMSLRRSVLICNTLRHIEREMEAEGVSMAAILAHSHAHPYGAAGAGVPPHGQNVVAAGGAGPHHCPDTIPSMPSTNHHNHHHHHHHHHHASLGGVGVEGAVGPLPSLHPPLIAPPLHPPPPPSTPPPSASLYSSDSPNPAYSPPPPYTHHDSRDPTLPFENPIREAPLPLRPFSPPPSISVERHGPLLPSTPSESLSPEEDTPTAHRACEDRAEGSINWCSVLSLSSQTDLDSMNNNECHEWNNEDGEAAPPTAALTQLTSRSTLISSQQVGGGATPSHNTLQYPLPPPVADSESGSSGGSGTSASPNWKLLPSLSADDVLKSFPEGSHRRHEEDLDSIIKVLVGS